MVLTQQANHEKQLSGVKQRLSEEKKVNKSLNQTLNQLETELQVVTQQFLDQVEKEEQQQKQITSLRQIQIQQEKARTKEAEVKAKQPQAPPGPSMTPTEFLALAGKSQNVTGEVEQPSPSGGSKPEEEKKESQLSQEYRKYQKKVQESMKNYYSKVAHERGSKSVEPTRRPLDLLKSYDHLKATVFLERTDPEKEAQKLLKGSIDRALTREQEHNERLRNIGGEIPRKERHL